MTVQLAVLAVLAGALSIASPCVLPLLPAYVGVISASSSTTPDQPRARVRSALLFVTGFTIVFVAFGAVASAVGQALRGRIDLLTQLAGAFLVVMGLRIVAGNRIRPFGRWSAAVHQGASRMPTPSTVALGAAVAIGWTPCIGPILASVLALSASSSTVYEGSALLALYSLGLGVPFVVVAVGLDRSRRLVRIVRRRGRAIERGGGVLLAVVGVGYLTGWWSSLFQGVQTWVARTGWPPL